MNKLIACILIFAAHSALAETASISVIPRPAKMDVVLGADFSINAKTTIIYADSNAKQPATMLREALRPAIGFSLEVKEGKKRDNSIFLTLNKNLPDLGQEGYTLKASPQGIET